MKFKTLFFFTAFILLFYNIYPQTDTSKKRIYLVGGCLVGGALGTYTYIQNSWWSDKQVPFHFDEGADMVYAKNVDKAGHFLGGLMSADIFTSSMIWSGMKRKKALWYGAVFGSGMQLAIEIKDGHAPYWGFSKLDLIFGTAGSLYPLFQYYNNNLREISFKFSYFKRSDIYWDLESVRGKEVSDYAWHDDYPNQTYWLAFNLNSLSKNSIFPDWLNLAIGFGLDDGQYLDENLTKKGGKNEWYIAIDYDVSKLLKRWDTSLGKNVKRWLNYFHFPAPTIRIAPKLEFYPLFL